MPALYLTEQGAVLRRTGERLVVTKDHQVVDEVPIIHVDQVVVVGNIQLTTPAVALLLQKDIDVVFLSSHGRFRGRLMTTGSRFAQLRHRQLRLMDDEAASLGIARAIVLGKLGNQQALLRQQEGQGVNGAVAFLEQAIAQAGKAQSVDSLRGVEGSAGARYFAVLKALIPPEWGFTKRVYHPPTDPANALLSFGYTLLLKDVSAAIQLVGLDPYLGFFHAIDYGRPSLALDAMEEFRPLVDGLVLRLIGQGEITPGDFQSRRRDKAVLLTDEARKGFVKAYEAQVNAPTTYAPRKEQTSYRRCIELQVRQLARLVLGKQKTFRPFKEEPPGRRPG